MVSCMVLVLCWFLLLVHVIDPWYWSMLLIHGIGPCYRSMLLVHVIDPWYWSMLLVHVINPCYWSMLSVHVIGRSPGCKPGLVLSVCQCGGVGRQRMSAGMWVFQRADVYLRLPDITQSYHRQLPVFS